MWLRRATVRYTDGSEYLRSTTRSASGVPFHGAITKIDLYQANAAQGLQRFSSGDVETGRFEFFFKRAMEKKRLGGDEEMCLNTLIGLVENGAHVDHIFEVCKSTFNLAESFVERNSINGGDVGLFGLNDVGAFVCFFAAEVNGMFTIAKYDVFGEVSKERTAFALRPGAGYSSKPMEPLEERPFAIGVESIEYYLDPKQVTYEITGLRYK